MVGREHLGLQSHQLLDRLLRAFFLCCPVVDLAPPFSQPFGGLGVTFPPQRGGLRITFFRAKFLQDWLQSIASTISKAYAKVLFTNLLETKAGLSPDCLKENSIEKRRGVAVVFETRLFALQKRVHRAKSQYFERAEKKFVRVHRRTMDLPEAA